MAKSFSKSVDEWAKKAEAALLDTFKEAFIEIGMRVIDRTPVDTGQAQGSWVASKNGPASGEAPVRDVEAAKAELRAIAGTLTLGDMGNLTSNAAHILELEYGRSDQAPQGMVRLTAQEFREIASEAFAKAKAKHGLK